MGRGLGYVGVPVTISIGRVASDLAICRQSDAAC